MYQPHAAGWALAASFCLFPVAAHATMFKCVAPDGSSTFSDKPCADKDGQKASDIKADSSLSNALARDQDRAVGQACSELADRSSKCGIVINNTIQTHFREGCYGPQHRYESDRARQAPRVRYDQIDWDHDYRFHQKTTAELKCNVLVTDMWEFVQKNFGKDLTEAEIRAVNYQTQALPANSPQTTIVKTKTVITRTTTTTTSP